MGRKEERGRESRKKKNVEKTALGEKAGSGQKKKPKP